MQRDDEDERGPTDPPPPGAAKRAAVSVKDDVFGDIEFDLIDEETAAEDTINDVFARDTAIPAPPEPPQASPAPPTGAETLRPREGAPAEGTPEAEPAPARAPTTEEPTSEELEFDSFDPPIDIFGHPIPGGEPVVRQQPPVYGHSEMPTAPPAAPFELIDRMKRSQPAQPRAPQPARPAPAPSPPSAPRRPAFMAETSRNPPLRAEQLARASKGGGSSADNRAAARPPSAPDRDSALDFVAGLDPLLDSLAPSSGLEPPARSSAAPRGGVREMQEHYAVGDFSRALSIAEDILARSPDDLVARRCAQSCRDVLTQMFTARIGPLDQVISVAIGPDEVQWLALDHRAGFLLSLVDGQSTVDEILDISGMTRLDALKIICDLTERQVVRLS